MQTGKSTSNSWPPIGSGSLRALSRERHLIWLRLRRATRFVKKTFSLCQFRPVARACRTEGSQKPAENAPGPLSASQVHIKRRSI
jgi:hypothetical protein